MGEEWPGSRVKASVQGGPVAVGVREKTKMFSNPNYPHLIPIKPIFTEASWKPVLHFLMMR